MLEDNISTLTFESSNDNSSYIKVIGVGGGGCNAVKHMYNEGIKGVDFIVCNTDKKSLDTNPVENKIALAVLGAGNNPVEGKKAAERGADVIRKALEHNTQMLFITAGMGGGTGTGAAPVIAEIAKSIETNNEAAPKILVVAVVTMPFRFEGNKRLLQAENGIAELSKHVDSILIINNDKLRSDGNFRITGAFAKADDVLLTAVKSISELITVNSYINIDFQDVNTVMKDSGTALMGAGAANGENRAIEAVEAAATSVLLNDNEIKGAKDVLLYLSFSPENEITMDEMGIVTDYITNRTDNPDCNVIWGYGMDESISDDTLKITLIATGFEKKKRMDLPETSNVRRTLPLDEPKQEPVVEQQPANDEIHIIPAQPVNEKNEVSSEPIVEPIATETNDIQNGTANTEFSRQRKVYVLETEPIEEEVAIEETQPQAETVQSDYDFEVHSRTAEQKVETIVFENPASAIERPSFNRAVEDRADRIRRMHEALRNDPNGPSMIENMTTEELNRNSVFATPHSSTREASRTTMNAMGVIANNAFLDDIPD